MIFVMKGGFGNAADLLSTRREPTLNSDGVCQKWDACLNNCKTAGNVNTSHISHNTNSAGEGCILLLLAK